MDGRILFGLILKAMKNQTTTKKPEPIITPSPRVIAGTNGTVAGLKALAASLERSRLK